MIRQVQCLAVPGIILIGWSHIFIRPNQILLTEPETELLPSIRGLLRPIRVTFNAMIWPWRVMDACILKVIPKHYRHTPDLRGVIIMALMSYGISFNDEACSLDDDIFAFISEISRTDSSDWIRFIWTRWEIGAKKWYLISQQPFHTIMRFGWVWSW